MIKDSRSEAFTVSPRGQPVNAELSSRSGRGKPRPEFEASKSRSSAHRAGHKTGHAKCPKLTYSGAVYVFVRTGARRSQQASFKASNSGIEDWFGLRLALSGDGDTLAVSAANEDGGAKGINGRQDDRSAPDAGAV